MSLPTQRARRCRAPTGQYRLRRKRIRFREFARRAGPALPSYLALHHAGFSVPPMLPSGRWALTPPFHPYQTERAFRRCVAGFPARHHRAALRWRSIFCGTFREQWHRLEHVDFVGTSSSLRHDSPGVTRRVALYPEGTVRDPKGLPARATACAITRQVGVRTFLPLSHLAMTKPAITRLTRCVDYIVI